jgi:hypothetical protein
MPRLFSMLAALALVVTAASGCKDALASPTLGPALEAQRAMPAQSAPARFLGHAKISCGTSATDIAVTMAGTGADANTKPQELFFFSDSTVVVRLISKNAVAATSGLPLCKTAGSCVNGITIPVQQHSIQCDSDGVATDIFVMGIAR